MTDQVRFEHAERVRDFYRNQGAAKERERILKHVNNRMLVLMKLFSDQVGTKEIFGELQDLETFIKGEAK